LPFHSKTRARTEVIFMVGSFFFKWS
jgi:hypothetical protein